MYRIGIVTDQDLELGRVRVRFPDRDQMRSYWLQVVTPKTLADKAFWMPDDGEQVVCLMDEYDEAGAVLGAVYSTVDTPPVQSPDKFHLSFRDGTVIEYDRAAHALTVVLCAGASATLNAPGEVLLESGGSQVSVTPSAIVLESGSSQVNITPNAIVLESGGSQVSITPAGVAISPPLPITSTVAQT
jgi:phage baseplate assembly protein V